MPLKIDLLPPGPWKKARPLIRRVFKRVRPLALKIVWMPFRLCGYCLIFCFFRIPDIVRYWYASMRGDRPNLNMGYTDDGNFSRIEFIGIESEPVLRWRSNLFRTHYFAGFDIEEADVDAVVARCIRTFRAKESGIEEWGTEVTTWEYIWPVKYCIYVSEKQAPAERREQIQTYLDAGGNVNACSFKEGREGYKTSGMSLLMLAIMAEEEEIVRLLIERGADVNYRPSEDWPIPLVLALGDRRPTSIVRLLRQAGAKRWFE